MGDVVRLSIVYETQQAAARLDELQNRGQRLDATNKKLSNSAFVTGGRLRGMALAGSRLSAVMAQGDLSAKGLAGSLGRLAGPTVMGALAVTVINLVTAWEEFKRISKDIEQTIDSMQDAARDASKDVQRMLGEIPQGESPAERAIKRLRDAAAQLRKEAMRVGGPAGKLLEDQAAALEAQIPGIGERAREGAAANEQRRLADATKDYNKSLRDSNTIMDMLNAGPLEQMNATMGIVGKRLQFLVENGKEASDEAQQLALLLGIGAQQMKKMERAQDLFRNGLFTMADAIEEFVTTGTLAFTDFLNNILRLLYRDFTGELIGGLVQQVGGRVGKGSVNVGTPEAPAPEGFAPSMQSNVTINVTAMDAQGVATFVRQHGPTIAAEVTRQAGRASAMRRTFRRG